MIKNNKKNKKGFTLVEMIVVISIILILSGILIPKVLGYQDKAKNAKVVNTARQIYDAAMVNYTENEGVFDSGKLKTSIEAVTDLALADSAVSVSDTDTKSATVTFGSDGKTYTVEIAANNNQFDVKDGSTQIYTNK